MRRIEISRIPMEALVIPILTDIGSDQLGLTAHWLIAGIDD